MSDDNIAAATSPSLCSWALIAKRNQGQRFTVKLTKVCIVSAHDTAFRLAATALWLSVVDGLCALLSSFIRKSYQRDTLCFEKRCSLDSHMKSHGGCVQSSHLWQDLRDEIPYFWSSTGKVVPSFTIHFRPLMLDESVWLTVIIWIDSLI